MSDLEKLDLKELGRRIKRARCDMGITQARLAELINVEAGHISRLENGKSNMGIVTYWRLCKALFIS